MPSNNIRLIHGNIFTTQCTTLVNTVNCMGVMGAGIALEFRYRYAQMFEKYVDFCKQGAIKIGTLWIYKEGKDGRKVLNFPTKNHWKQPSTYDYVERGLAKFVSVYREKEITSVAFPMLGALNGGLDPEKVLVLMQNYLSQCDIVVEIYEYDGQAEDDLIGAFSRFIQKADAKTIERKSGGKLKKVAAAKLKAIFEESAPHSLIQLGKVRGISEPILMACFELAMSIKGQMQEMASTSDMFAAVEEAKKSSIELPAALIEQIEQSAPSVSMENLYQYCEAKKIDNSPQFVSKYFERVAEQLRGR